MGAVCPLFLFLLMRGRGYILVELLVVLAIIAVLATIAIPSYRAYRVHAVKTALTHDLRTCLSQLEVAMQSSDSIDTAQVVSQCPRGSETRSIQLVSNYPNLSLRAGASDMNLVCVFKSANGRFECE